MQAEWVRSLRNQCARAGVSFFFKQWGGVHKSKAGRDLDSRTHDEMPPVETRLPPSDKSRVALIRAGEEIASRMVRPDALLVPSRKLAIVPA
jgi:Protein of unknown function (DUF5131)